MSSASSALIDPAVLAFSTTRGCTYFFREAWKVFMSILFLEHERGKRKKSQER
jgi:hypothetical protein